METVLTENFQPEERINHRYDGILDVHSIFDTIQGEGPFAGMPATFVRLAGCNLKCFWCDTDYTSKRMKITDNDLMAEIESMPRRDLVVLTGGEPFRQDFTLFASRVLQSGRKFQVETNGTIWLDVAELRNHWHEWFKIVCSPKTPSLNAEMWRHIDALKYVVEAGKIDKDGLPLTSVGPQYGRPARPPEDWHGEIYVQPLDLQDEKENKANLRAAAQSCMDHGYRLTVQIHKEADLP